VKLCLSKLALDISILKVNMSNPLLGFVSEHHAPSRDEEDQRERSSKKVKNSNNDTVMQEEGGVGLKVGFSTQEIPAIATKTYKESVSGTMSRAEGGETEGRKDRPDGVEDDDGMEVEGPSKNRR
jgi:hypothetical protein